MAQLLATIVLIIILVFVFIVLPIIAIQLFFYIAPVLFIVYILYKIFGPKKPVHQQYYEESKRPSPDDVVDVDFTVHEVKDDKED